MAKQGRQFTYNVTMSRVLTTIVAVEILITHSFTHSECVSLVLILLHSKRMRRIILLSVACLALPNSSTFSHKRHEFREKKSYWT
jgi:hypothetical protein